MSKVSKQEFEKLEERVLNLEEMLDTPSVYGSRLYSSLYERTTGLYAKYHRLMSYLGLEEVTEPEVRAIRKVKPAPNKAAERQR